MGMVYIMWAVPKHNTEDKRDEIILKIVYKMKIQPVIFAAHSSILLCKNLLVVVNVFIIVY